MGHFAPINDEDLLARILAYHALREASAARIPPRQPKLAGNAAP